MGKMCPRTFFLMLFAVCLVLTPSHQEAPKNVCSQDPSPSLGLVVLGLLIAVGLLIVGVVYGIRRWRMASVNRIVAHYSIEEPPITVTNGSKTTTYYQGSIRYADERSVRPASFIQVADFEHANRIIEIGITLNHKGVVKPICIIQHNPGETLIAVERFQFLCANWDNQTRDRFRKPNNNTLVPGNPIESTQDQIRNLSSTLLYLHSKGVSCSGLSSTSSYFWDGEDFKVLPDMADDVTKETDIKELGSFIRLMFLNTNNKKAWIQRDQFIACFYPQMQLRNPDERLLMIINHPFLCKNIKTILQIFPDLYHALESMEYNERHGMEFLVDQLAIPGSLCNNRLEHACFQKANDPWESTWYDSNMHSDLDMVMQYGYTPRPTCRPSAPPQPILKGQQVYSYDVTNCHDLIRFCRNTFEHCYGIQRYGPKRNPPKKPKNTPTPTPPKFAVRFLYLEINKCWPELIYLLHELSYSC